MHIKFASQMWATRPHLGSIFEKLLHQKTFYLPAACLRETTCVRFGKAGAHPQLALEIAIAPETLSLITTFFILKGNCDSSDSLLDFRFILWCSFDLLRKCGLLAHTSAAFLKNCCTKKLFSCLRLVLEKPLAYGSARLGHIPSLPWKSQLPLKPYLSLQPFLF